MEHPREHWLQDVVKSPPYGPVLLFARDDARSTPEVAAGVVAETCEGMLSLWEPDLGPTWGLDVEHPPAPDAHVGTEECIRTVHRDRCVVDCADTCMQIGLEVAGGAEVHVGSDRRPRRPRGFPLGHTS